MKLDSLLIFALQPYMVRTICSQFESPSDKTHLPMYGPEHVNFNVIHTNNILLMCSKYNDSDEK